MIEIEITTTEVGTTEQVTTKIEVAGAGPQGATGPQGPQGPQGEPGEGILPVGGDTGDILVKLSAEDGDAGWTSDYATSAQGDLADTATQPGDNVSTLTNDANYIDASGAPVQSVDGKTGAVDLSSDYDALGSASTVQSNLTAHENATTSVHGIADTDDLIIEGDARLSNERTPVDGSVTDAKITASGLSPSAITGTAVINNDARLSEGLAASETVRSLGTGSTQALPGNYDVAGQAPVQSVDGKTGAVDLSGDYDALGSASAVQSNLTGHINDATNPHSVTKEQVGLGSVDNVSAASLRDRATHTGTQTLSTISDAGTIASQDADNVAITGGSIDASIAYDNTNSDLTATLVQTAIDELDQKKLNVSALTASIKFFPTTAAGAVAGYGRLVTDTGDADYDEPAVAVTVGPFSGTDQLLGSLVSDAGVLEGNTTPINVTTIGNVRRSSGNQNDAADFFFEVYKRDSGGTETLIGTSSNSAEVSADVFQEFFADCLIQDTLFTETDRLVLKFYGNVRNGSGNRTYEFQYGGNQPVRTLFPVPVTVVPNGKTAADVQVNASEFSGLLSGTDDDVQTALGTLDAVTKSDIGLGNVDNVSAADLRDRSTHTGTQAATTVTYDNTTSGLTATNVKDALDELAAMLSTALRTE